MNIYVYDHGWSGADFYIGNTIEDAKSYFRSLYLPEYIERAKNHNERNGHNPWLHFINFFESDDFGNIIQTYEIRNGLTIRTYGDQ